MANQRPAAVYSDGSMHQIDTGDVVDPTYLPAGSGAETATTIGALINAAGNAVPNDSDLVATAESGGLLKKITWTNVKAFLKTYFDTLYHIVGTDVPITDGGTGSSTAAGAATNLGLGTGDSPQFTSVNIGNASDTTLSRVSAGDLQIETNRIFRVGGADVPVADGGTGASDIANAQINLKIPRTLFAYIEDETTATAGEETLVTDDIVAATLVTNKDRIDFQYNGIFAANANEKYLNLYFNGVQRFSSDVQSGNGKAWEIRGRIIRYSNTTVRLSFIFTTDLNPAGAIIDTGQVDVAGLNLTTTNYALALKADTPDAAGDVIMNSGSIDYKPF